MVPIYTVLVRRDAHTTTPATIPEYELPLMQEIFGKENVYDFSGINEFTEDYHNYYEAGHYRPLLGNKLLERIYKRQ